MTEPRGTLHPLPLTGERTVPGIPHENYWFRRHEAAYRALAPLCRGARLLEAGCGEGYGADLLGREASVVALDYDAGAAAHAARAYPRVRVVRGNLAALPFAAGVFDVVVSLQTVEHIWDQPGFIAECARVLRPGGRLLLTTPNRLTFSPGTAPGERPLNPFHTRELDPDELGDLLGAAFEVTTLGGLHHGARLRAWERRHGSLVTALLEAGEPGSWPAELLDLVTGIGADDFVVRAGDPAVSLDLLAVAVRPDHAS